MDLQKVGWGMDWIDLAQDRAVAYQGGFKGFGGVQPPPPEIPKALQNRAKLNPTVKTVKNC